MTLSDLIGKEIKGDMGEKYIITEVFPYYVKGRRILENGVELVQCFNIGDLVVNGFIQVQAMPYTQGYRFKRGKKG